MTHTLLAFVPPTKPLTSKLFSTNRHTQKKHKTKISLQVLSESNLSCWTGYTTFRLLRASVSIERNFHQLQSRIEKLFLIFFFFFFFLFSFLKTTAHILFTSTLRALSIEHSKTIWTIEISNQYCLFIVAFYFIAVWIYFARF